MKREAERRRKKNPNGTRRKQRADEGRRGQAPKNGRLRGHADG
jgi:hypothetical protein